jgi:hypothetical protein
MSAWLGVSPLIGAGSLDGFAIGALASGACFLAIAAPRRARRRRAFALSEDPPFGSGSPDGWLCEHVMAAEAFPADAERLVEPDMPDVQPDGAERMGEEGRAETMAVADQAGDGPDQAFPASRGGRTAGSHRSRHRRLGGSIPGSEAPRRRFGGASALRKAAWPDNPLPAGTSRHAAFPDSAPCDDEVLGGARRSPELAFPDGTFGSSRRPEVRGLPRHAAPGISLSSRLSAGMSTLMTSLSATRAMLGGAHG